MLFFYSLVLRILFVLWLPIISSFFFTSSILDSPAQKGGQAAMHLAKHPDLFTVISAEVALPFGPLRIVKRKSDECY